MDNVNQEIWSTYNKLKCLIKTATQEKNINKSLQNVTNLWMFMNRFRNCDLKFYFDEDIYSWISDLNSSKKNHYHKELKNKTELKLAFIVIYLSDLGGASVPHRFMLRDFEWEGKKVKNYFLVTNFFKKGEPSTDSYEYLKNNIKPEEIKFLSPDLTHEERGEAIQTWLIDKDIDIVIAQTCPSTLYALSSNCVPVIANLSQDCYTFTLGPGFGDLTYLVTLDQLFKYNYKLAKEDHYSKIIMLPLHSTDQLEKAEKINLEEFNIPSGAIVSASSNMWKSFFGDSEDLMMGITKLIREYPFYHHIFIGTPRCIDNLESYLIKNPDIRDKVHFIGAVKNIYRILKSIDFWINSFPTSGGTNIEMAKIGKPSIDIAINRNLDLHPAEFLCVKETTVISLDEFVELGRLLITNKDYRNDLGKYVETIVKREFDKERLVSERIYKELVMLYQKKLTKDKKMPKINLKPILEYEKRISLYNSYGLNHWTEDKKERWLKECTNNFPTKSFAWIKLLENSILNEEPNKFESIEAELTKNNISDYRVKVYLSLGYFVFKNPSKSLKSILEIIELVKNDEIPLKIALIIFLKLGKVDEALKLFKRKQKNSKISDIDSLLNIELKELLPLYYNY